MDKFRILQIHIYNFKGFKELSLDLSSNSFTIWGGKNGFGKTTLFDAIELVLSGSIKRMSQYVTNADKRYNYNGKPLVYDCSIQTVYVEILVELESGIYWLKREAMVEDIKNPIDFSIFSTLYIRPNIDKVEYAITKDSDILPSSIIKQYKFLHYLDQEECTAFLKSNEKSRNELVTKLFRTQNFDNDLSKMVDCKAKLDSIIITNKDRLENIDRKLNILRNAGTLEGDLEEIEYIPLTKTLPEWDKENPKLNINQYLELLSENGLIDNIRYFVDNNNEYNKYKIAKYLAPYLWLVRILWINMFVLIGTITFLFFLETRSNLNVTLNISEKSINKENLHVIDKKLDDLSDSYSNLLTQLSIWVSLLIGIVGIVSILIQFIFTNQYKDIYNQVMNKLEDWEEILKKNEAKIQYYDACMCLQSLITLQKDLPSPTYHKLLADVFRMALYSILKDYNYEKGINNEICWKLIILNQTLTDIYPSLSTSNCYLSVPLITSLREDLSRLIILKQRELGIGEKGSDDRSEMRDLINQVELKLHTIINLLDAEIKNLLKL